MKTIIIIVLVIIFGTIFVNHRREQNALRNECIKNIPLGDFNRYQDELRICEARY